MPELEEAFLKNDEDFLSAYGFAKPARNAMNVVVACRTGGRGTKAIHKLQDMGYGPYK